VKRQEILETATRLHIDVLFIIRNAASDNDAEVWNRIMRSRCDLRLEMETLDVAAYTNDVDGWYATLGAWSTKLFKIIGDELKSSNYTGIPSDATRAALYTTEKPSPVIPMYTLQILMRTSTEQFNKKWAAETAKV
jgi:hypothetical protein